MPIGIRKYSSIHISPAKYHLTAENLKSTHGRPVKDLQSTGDLQTLFIHGRPRKDVKISFKNLSSIEVHLPTVDL